MPIRPSLSKCVCTLRHPPQCFSRLTTMSLRWPDNAGLAGDAAVVLDAPVAGEIENGFLAEHRGVEIAIGDDEFVLLGLGLGDDFAVRIDDHAAGDHRVAI